MVQPSNICPRSEPIQLLLNYFQVAEKLLSPFRCSSAMVSSPNTYMGPLERCLREPIIFLQLILNFQSQDFLASLSLKYRATQQASQKSSH